jgi:hypothetical protein
MLRNNVLIWWWWGGVFLAESTAHQTSRRFVEIFVPPCFVEFSGQKHQHILEQVMLATFKPINKKPYNITKRQNNSAIKYDFKKYVHKKAKLIWKVLGNSIESYHYLLLFLIYIYIYIETVWYSWYVRFFKAKTLTQFNIVCLMTTPRYKT